jgi:molybdopterin converting factor small subunit
MQVTLNFLGLLREYVGAGEASFALRPGAVYGDLLREIDARFGNRMPDSIWDKSGCRFRPGILSVGEGRDLDDPSAELRDNETIAVTIHMAGG